MQGDSSISALSCAAQPALDITAAAGQLSHIAGIFAALVVPVLFSVIESRYPPQERRGEDNDPLLAALPIAFFSLTFSAFMYGLLSGTRTCVKAYVLNVGTASLFTLSVLQVLLCIAWYLTRFGRPYPAVAITRLLALLVLVGAAYIVVQVRYVFLQVYDLQPWSWADRWLVAGGVGSLTVLPLVGWQTRGFLHRGTGLRPQRLSTALSHYRLALASSTWSLLGIALVFGLTSEAPDDVLRGVPPLAYAGFLVVLGAQVLLYLLAIPSPPEAQRHSRATAA